ncbi:hypothetical protein IMZ48_45575 [Candidatus Bathyarchaeota archaeon]|nr:hypothetical protein [Candidatus Bathyarchaeota archaeon]
MSPIEGGGGQVVVEAELCTSTSRDVAEVFNRGGIARVLGRPKILEIAYISTRMSLATGIPLAVRYRYLATLAFVTKPTSLVRWLRSRTRLGMEAMTLFHFPTLDRSYAASSTPLSSAVHPRVNGQDDPSRPPNHLLSDYRNIPLTWVLLLQIVDGGLECGPNRLPWLAARRSEVVHAQPLKDTRRTHQYHSIKHAGLYILPVT